MGEIHFLQSSRLYRKLIHGPHSEFASAFADRLFADQLTQQCTMRSLTLVLGFAALSEMEAKRARRRLHPRSYPILQDHIHTSLLLRTSSRYQSADSLGALLGLEVHMVDTEQLGIAVLPLEIVHQAPDEIVFHRQPLARGAAAPSLDLAAPDIYDRASRNVFKHVDLYTRADNALMMPEIGNAAEYARYFWAALGRGVIGFAPFGMGGTGYYNPLGAKGFDDATLDAFAAKYRIVAAAPWAKIAFDHPVWGAAEPDDGAPVSTTMGDWTIIASFGH